MDRNDLQAPGTLLQGLFAEPVQRVVLDNGLIVLHKEDFANPLVSAQLWFKTGSIHEGALLGSGLSHYLEHLLFKETQKRKAGEIAAQVQAVGGNINAYTSFDRTVYYLDLPSEALPLGLDILADMGFAATLPADEVTRERNVILREIDMGLDDPDRQVGRAIFRNAFRQHPYRFPVIGERPLFEAVQRPELQHYYRSRYVPNNAVLVVVGAVESSALLELAQSTFGHLPMARLDSVHLTTEPDQLALREEHLEADVNVCRGGMAFRIPSLWHPHAPALDVLGMALGHGRSSRLWQGLREKRRLVHHIDASVWNPGATGLFWVSYLCDSDKRAQVEQAILQEVEALAQRPISGDELDKARRLALVGEVNVRKTVSGQASRLGLTETVVGDIGYSRRHLERLQSVTTEEVATVAKAHLHRDCLTSVSLNARRPAKVIAPSSTSRSREPEGFQLKTLTNGARLVWRRDTRLPKIHLRLAGLGGPLYEEPSSRGVTGLVASLLARDTEFRSAPEVARSVEEIGAQFSEFVGNNSFGLTLEFLSQDLTRALPVLEEAALHPAFTEESLEVERRAQIAQIHEDLDEIVEHGRRTLRQRFFGAHPFASDAYGEVDSLTRLSRADVRANYTRLMVAPNIVLAACGDLDPDRDLPLLEAFLHELPAFAFRRAEATFPSIPATVGLHHETLPREQAVVFHAFPDVGIKDARYPAGELVEEVLSDMSGRLFMRVREHRSLAYFVGASRLAGLDGGMFSLYGGTQPDSAQEVLAEMQAEMQRLRQGDLSQDELDRARTRLKAQKRMSLQGPGSWAAEGSLNVLYGLPLDNWRRYGDELDRLSLTDVRAYVEQQLRPDHALSLIIGPK